MGPSGRVDLTHVTGFESRQLTYSVRVSRLDGTQIGAELPRGWEGSFEIERGTSEVDDFVAAAEQLYYNGGPVPAGTMYQYVTEVDGSTSTYQYNGVVFRLASAGAWKGAKIGLLFSREAANLNDPNSINLGASNRTEDRRG
jgi:hypothetical protein